MIPVTSPPIADSPPNALYHLAMPELPEVECIRQTLSESLLGATMTGVTLRRADVLSGTSPISKSHALLKGRRIVELKRHGKQLALCSDADGPVLIVQLGMTGQLFTAPAKEKSPPHTHAIWRFHSATGEGQLLFRDPRRFGGLVACATPAALRERWAALGPDAASITARQFAIALHSTRGPRTTPIKALLLNQSLIAGVGNIYADEALFLAGIAPHRHASTLAEPEVRALAAAIRTVLRNAIRSGGSTIRDYRDGTGSEGHYQRRHRVYARGGQPCLECNTTLVAMSLAQRTTVWCPKCQSS